MKDTHPTLAHRLLNAHAGELRVVVLAFLYHFCLLCGYYAIRPLRDTLGIERGDKALPYLYTGTLIVTLILHPLYSALVARLPRRIFIPLVYHAFTVVLIAFLALLNFIPRELSTELLGVELGQRELVGYTFFIFVSVFNLFVISVFWSLMTDVFSERQGKRLFGSLAAGGSAGAILGGLLAWRLAEQIGSANMLIISIVLLQLAVVLVRKLFRFIGMNTSVSTDHNQTLASDDSTIGGKATAGITHVLRSPYLLGIAVLMFSLTICNTYLYFQKAEIVAETIADEDARTAFFGQVDVFVNVATLIIQFFIVGRLLRIFGIVAVIVFLPIIFVLGFSMLALWQSLTIYIVLDVLTRSGRYAIMRPCRELLYSVLSREDKYKSKNLNDTFVYRFGDQVGAWSKKAMEIFEFTTPSIAFVGAGVATIMGVVAYRLGKKQQKLAAAEPTLSSELQAHA